MEKRECFTISLIMLQPSTVCHKVRSNYTDIIPYISQNAFQQPREEILEHVGVWLWDLCGGE